MNRITRQMRSDSAECTRRIGTDLGSILLPGDVVCLWGGLGSGKTTLVQGICSGLEVIDDVVSPSFALINQYRGRLNVYHIDLYRINADNEASSLGLEECFYGNGVSLVEWPERAGSLLPEERLDVRMRWIGENTRNLELIPKGNAWDERFSN